MRLSALILLLLSLGTVAMAQDTGARNPSTAVTGSLFNPSVSQPLGSITADFKARSIGDIVTIRVLESTQSTINATSESNRQSEASFGIPNAAGLGGRFILPHLPGAIPSRIFSGNGNAKFSGEGTVERNSEFSTTIAARVVEVMPNGDLVIEANKEVEVNREKQTMRLMGIIRVQDVNANNVVLSSDVAELRVHLTGKGFIADANKPGWLFRFLQKISPF